MNVEQKQVAIPVQGSERIDVVDILRGFAVLGILVANMASYSGRSTNPLDFSLVSDRFLINAFRFLIEAKFYSLFSFLFGWGMSIQMTRAMAKGVNFETLYLRRLLVLFLFGVLHGTLLWYGDILTLYAVLGVVLLFFRKRSPRFLLVGVVISLLFALVLRWPGAWLDMIRNGYVSATDFMRQGTPPATSVYATGSYAEIAQRRLWDYLNQNSWTLYFFGNVFSMFLLGLYVGKRQLLQRIEQHLRLVRWVWLFGLVVGSVGNGLYVWMTLHPEGVPPAYAVLARTAPRTIGAPALMLFYVSSIILLGQRSHWRARLRPLSYVGRMALSNYLLQTVVATTIFYGYGLGFYGQVDPLLGLLLTAVIYVAQIHASRWWLSRYQYGPMEWVWRTLTYGRRQPLRQETTGLSLVSRLDERRRSVWWWVLLAGCVLVVLTVGWWQQNGRVATTDGMPEAVLPAIVRRATVTPQPMATATVIGTRETAVATPVVTPVAYNPGPVAASGNVGALAEIFDVDEALAHVEALAAPVMAGRLAGDAGGILAGEYIAEQFAAYGLQPAGESGTFFQSFPITYTTLRDVPILTVEMGEAVHEAALYEAFAPFMQGYAGAGEGGGEVVWVQDCSEDDFIGLDVVDKVVFCRTNPSRRAMIMAGRYALQHGATGLLLWQDEGVRAPDFGDIYRPAWVPEPLPTLRLFEAGVDELLWESGETITTLLQAETAIPLHVTAQLRIVNSGETVHEARNVLGVLPGRDPDFADEVIIIGGHYDHLGAAPDGTIWAGANDNASGMGVMLAIAQSWQEAGYVPRRTVLFAAWDGEEHGLLGSRYYVAHPRYPLTRTVASLQMDMVGAGSEVLSISGEQGLTTQLLTLAEGDGIPAMITDLGRSDHVPFLQADVPASLLIWFDEAAPPTHYHRPVDVATVVEVEKLAAVAHIVNTAVLNLAESEPAILTLMAQRQKGVAQGERSTFLATSHESQVASDGRWFDDLQRLGVSGVQLQLGEIMVRGDVAVADVALRLEYPREGETAVVERVLRSQFVRDGATWRWHGPDVVRVAGDRNQRLTVAYPATAPQNLAKLGAVAGTTYANVATLLGMEPMTDSTLMVLPDGAALQASTSFLLSESQSVWVEANEVRLVYTPEISGSSRLTETMAHLLLANAGVEETAVPWLWRGLPLVLQTRAEPVQAQSEHIPQLFELLIDETAVVSADAFDWAATSYLLAQVGWEGLGTFVTVLGERCQVGGCDEGGVTAALQAVGQPDAATFAAMWQADWQKRLQMVQVELDRLLAVRVAAANDGDGDAFVATVDARWPHLMATERAWLAAFTTHGMTNLQMTAMPRALLANGDVLAEVVWQYEMIGSLGVAATETRSALRLFTRRGEGYRWAGSPLREVAGDLIRVRYGVGDREEAAMVLARAERLYGQLAEQLGVTVAEPLVIELLPLSDDFRISISPMWPNQPWLTGWHGVDAGLKVRSADEAVLVTQLTRFLLMQFGVEAEWLLKGVPIYVARSLDNGRLQMDVAASLPALTLAVQAGELPDLLTLPPDEALSANGYVMAHVQSWDAVRYFVHRYGWEGLLALVQGGGDEVAMAATTGGSALAFGSAWVDSLAQNHISTQWRAVATGFSAEAAMVHAEVLVEPEMAGRRAGTAGAEQAAAYIAEQFAAYGLIPLEDEGTFLQHFPITTTALSFVPRLGIRVTETAVVYAYRAEFLLLNPVFDQDEVIDGELVWVANGQEVEANLQGKVVVVLPEGDVLAQVNRLAAQGAKGVVVAGRKREDGAVWGKRPLVASLSLSATIPVFELTQQGYSRLLAEIGHDRQTIQRLLPVAPLGVHAFMEVRAPAPAMTMTANVLGVWPGRDVTLAQEVVVLGAHYDHVGDDPEVLICPVAVNLPPVESCRRVAGLRYPGANDNASGVAVLLEIARLWQEVGYAPQRTVLFAAWGGQELGQLGAHHFLSSGVVAVTDIEAMVQLDGVAGGDGFNLGVQGVMAQDGLLLHSMMVAQMVFEEKFVTTEPVQVSDDWAFREASVPALLVSWRLADEHNLPEGLANGVNPTRIKTAGVLVTLALMQLAQ